MSVHTHEWNMHMHVCISVVVCISVYMSVVCAQMSVDSLNCALVNTGMHNLCSACIRVSTNVCENSACVCRS